MAGFCTKCGSPLPENGICPCSAQQTYAPQEQTYIPQQQYVPQQQYAPQQPYAAAPQYRAQPSAFGQAMKNLPNLLTGYFRDPVGTSRLAVEKKDSLSGLIILGAQVVLALIGILLFSLIHLVDEMPYFYNEFGDVVLQWILVSILAPVLAFGVNLGLSYALAAIAKVRVDAKSLVALSGICGILPTILLACSLLLGMIAPFVFYLFAVLMFAAWIISFFTAVFQVLGIKMNIVSMLVLLAGMTAAFFLLEMMLCWLLFDGNVLTLIGLIVY